MQLLQNSGFVLYKCSQTKLSFIKWNYKAFKDETALLIILSWSWFYIGT